MTWWFVPYNDDAWNSDSPKTRTSPMQCPNFIQCRIKWVIVVVAVCSSFLYIKSGYILDICVYVEVV